MRRLKALPLAALTITAAVFITCAARADVLADIKAKGEIIIGVKEFEPPFGFRNDGMELQGLEIDLARDIASRLDLQLTLFPITSTSRLQFIELGLNDLLIGTLAVTERRKQQVKLVEPSYYASTISLLTGPKVGAKSLADLQGKTVCTMTGAYYNEALAEHSAKLSLHPVHTMDEAVAALRKGKCLAFANTTFKLIHLQQRQKDRQLADGRLIPFDIPPLPWAIAINAGAAGSDLEKALSAAVTDWHRSGKLKALEMKWLGRNSEWVLRQHEAYQ